MLTSRFVLAVFVLAPLARAQPFVDRTADFGCEIGAGPASWGDVNSDGWPDLYAGGAVWINRGGKSFDRFEAPGNGLIADLDNDGVGDLISLAPPGLYRGRVEEGSVRFEPIALPALPETVCRGAAAGEFNGDGLLDVYFGGYEDWGKQVTYPSLVLMSKPGPAYEVEIISREYRARGVTACDFDEDGDLDIYVSNYRLQPNVMWVNDGRGVFENRAGALNALATSEGFSGGHSIGACWGDFDGDGRFDLFAGNFAHVDKRGDQPKSRFLRGLGAGKSWVFDDLGTCGVWYQESYASPGCADFDNDGALDLYFTTVYADASFGKKNHPVLYRNESTDGGWVFKDVSEGSGLEGLPPTYQAAWADVDRDGRIDLVTAGRLYLNSTTSGAHWLELRLQGDGVKINRGAVGAQARIALPDGRVLTRQVEVGTGEGNASSPILHFGLGAYAGPITVEIRWPGGSTRALTGVAVDRVMEAEFSPIDAGAK
ncbi:MAG: CRTAC1 family protein [Phycisphaerales bacterium]|nr:CRTAC1 family protein [Phycisphaerales bacterium]